MSDGKEPRPGEGSLAGSLLVAMPSLGDPNFAQTVVYLCSHSPEEAMGLIVNRPVDSPGFEEVLRHFDIEPPSGGGTKPVHMGGPVEQGKGFVLHTGDYRLESSMPVADPFVLTSSVDILRDLAEGKGPRRSLVALGYSGWSAGQLDRELRENAWLVVAASEEMVFGFDDSEKWTRAFAEVDGGSGKPIDPSRISPVSGNA